AVALQFPHFVRPDAIDPGRPAPVLRVAGHWLFAASRVYGRGPTYAAPPNARTAWQSFCLGPWQRSPGRRLTLPGSATDFPFLGKAARGPGPADHVLLAHERPSLPFSHCRLQAMPSVLETPAPVFHWR